MIPLATGNLYRKILSIFKLVSNSFHQENKMVHTPCIILTKECICQNHFLKLLLLFPFHAGQILGFPGILRRHNLQIVFLTKLVCNRLHSAFPFSLAVFIFHTGNKIYTVEYQMCMHMVLIVMNRIHRLILILQIFLCKSLHNVKRNFLRGLSRHK